MSDSIVMLVLGVLITVLGIININGNISTLHWYHRKRIAESDIPAFGKAVGTGTVIIGAGLIVSGVLSLLKIKFAEIILIAGVIVGLPIMLYAIVKYNKGLF